jgi:hypothetical protein
MYDFMNTTLPAVPKRRLLFFLRQHLENRRLHNLDALTAVAEAYNIPFSYGPAKLLGLLAQCSPT